MRKDLKTANESVQALALIKARGERLKRLRHLANLSRKDLCKLGGLNESTLKGWEIGRHGGLSEQGAKKLIALFAIQGISCHLDWLLHHEGVGPKVDTDFDRKRQSIVLKGADKDLMARENELALFRLTYPNSTHLVVPDSTMKPVYTKKDLVAGVKYIGDDILTLDTKIVIAKFHNGKKILRILHINKEKTCYLLSLTLKSKQNKAFLLSDFSYFAPVTWHRKPTEI